jgi:hypothetical protein
MKRLGEDVRSVLAAAGAQEADAMAEIVRAWPDAVGDAIGRAAWPARLSRDGTLHVATVSSTWAFELGRMADEVLGRLSETISGSPPAALRFAVGPVPEPLAPAAATAPAGPPPPGAETVAEAHALAAAIDDEELRDLVARAAAASLARARDDRRFW